MDINIYTPNEIPDWVYGSIIIAAILIAIAVFIWHLINNNGGGTNMFNNNKKNIAKGNNNNITIENNYNFQREEYSTEEILLAYLMLCREFMNSEIWKDKNAKLCYMIDPIKTKTEDHPMLKLYIPVSEASELYDKFKSDIKNIKKIYSEIKHLANKIWYAIGENDVRLTTDGNIVVVIGKKIKNTLSQCYDKDEPINRAYLLHISEKIATTI